MSRLISIENVCLSFSAAPVLDHVNLQIDERERICLIGRNGAGKSSLLKLIEGKQLADSGTIWRKPLLRLARLPQELPREAHLTVYDYVAQGLSQTGQLLTAYHAAAQRVAQDNSAQALAELTRLQQAIDACQGWQYEQQINTILTRLGLNSDTLLGELSGGWQRRAALARALVTNPELLLLDEPTNHLDIDMIQWLEDQLINATTGLLFVTHDRSLLQRLATRIIELDRGQLRSFPGDYNHFLRRKEELLEAEASANALFDKKLSQEERWIRQGIKARRTRNEGRVRALKALRKERAQRRDVPERARFTLNEHANSGKLVIEAEHITHQFDQKVVIRDFSVRIMRGDRIGLIGPNGAGKSTLLAILLGQLTPQQGQIKHGTHLHIAYFDQLRNALNPEQTVIDNLAYGAHEITLNGKKRHIISYLGDFLFSPERAMTPVKALSGGECNRLLLARLFMQPANVLVLDEPTNDLDIETLELLEDMLSEYSGTLLVVSHDRQFLDNSVTSTLAFTADGIIQEYIGGYEDFLRQRGQSQAVLAQEPSSTTMPKKSLSTVSTSSSSHRAIKQSVAKVMKRIAELEQEQQQLQSVVGQENFYTHNEQYRQTIFQRLGAIETKLQDAYREWENLE